MKTPYVTATALALALHSVGSAQERAPASDSIPRDVIREIGPPTAAIAGYRTSKGFICGFLKGHDQLRVTLKARRNCYGDLLNSVVFHGDGRAGPYSELADTKRELSRSQRAGYVVTVTYEPERPDQPEGCWCDNRVIEWSAAPPPVREQGPEAAAVSAEVTAAVGSAARAAAAQPQAGAAEAPAGEAVTEMHPGPQTASGFICSVKRNREKWHVTMELKAMEDCLGQSKADVVFPGAGRATEQLLRRVREDGAVVTVTYMPVTNHVISWESSPPPVRQQRPEAAAVTADVAAAVGRDVAGAALQPERGGAPAAQAPAGEAVTEMRPGPQTAFGYICSIKKNDKRDYLRLTLQSEEDCRGQRKADVVFPGDGNKGFWSKLAYTDRQLTSLKEANFVVSVTYVSEPDGIPGYPELWDRVIDWEAAPPPAIHDRPEVAAVGAEVAAGRAAAAAAARSEPSEPDAAEVVTSDALTKMRPRPVSEPKYRTGAGYVCRIERRAGAPTLRVTFRNQTSCGGSLVADVIFPADGEKGPLFDLEKLEREMRRLKAEWQVVSFNYVPEPDGTHRGIEFSY